MKGIVLIEDHLVVHVIPRDEIRYAEVVERGGDGWTLKYQLAGAIVVRSIEWAGDSRPESLKDTIGVGSYNQMAAGSLLAMLTRGHRDLHLERRADNLFLVRSGLVEDDAHAALCRQFVAELLSKLGLARIDDRHNKMLHEIQAAARDLTLPDWYPLVKAP